MRTDALHEVMHTVVDVFGPGAAWLLLTPSSLAAAGAILLLERRYPAVTQRTFAPGLALDAVYFLVSSPIAIWILAQLGPRIDHWLRAHVGWLEFRGADHWPAWLTVLGALLVTDFLFWAVHLLRHRVPLLWRLHQVHHSQTELRFLSDRRVHVAEWIGGGLLTVPMLFVVGPELSEFNPPMAALTAALVWYPLVYHANLRTDLGPLRHVLITPQSHRIHHSIDETHHDTNFGYLLNIWDRIFGTLHQPPGVYPATGLAGSPVPMEVSASARSLLAAYVSQFVYPFRSHATKRHAAEAPPTRDVIPEVSAA